MRDCAHDGSVEEGASDPPLVGLESWAGEEIIVSFSVLSSEIVSLSLSYFSELSRACFIDPISIDDGVKRGSVPVTGHFDEHHYVILASLDLC